jgi:hypothetical protein
LRTSRGGALKMRMMSGPDPLARYIDLARKFEMKGRWQ